MKYFSFMRLFICLYFLFFINICYSAQLTIAVSLPPYASILNRIGGERVDVITLLSQGSDPHNYEPKPEILKEFSKATVYFSDGSLMDKSWMPRFKGVNKNVKVIDLSNGISWNKDVHNNSKYEHKHSHEESLDPHIWTSPKRVMVIAKNIFDNLVQLDMDGKKEYELNYNEFMNELNTLDKELLSTIEKIPEKNRTFIVFHPSYGYFAHDYHMTQLAIEVEGKEPKPKDLSRLISLGKKHLVRIVFVQPQFSKRSASVIAKELNAVIVSTDPLAYNYLDNIRILIKTISEVSVK